ncbi:FecR domain-containing protein [Steroidobacter sp. S1-65]|uniref:FecR domain-containing protein n=1 Tax=Steroidobacter gossypii TaxID=2805490 RepID=A0ABS1WZJ2_9GAMM|nr:FecR domain-containing protein [Steroidobacter gossypii]MBM0106386.1 FecR domain-containing protein [Steroidobacter gossypii]
MDNARDKNADAVVDEASEWLVRLNAPEVSLDERRAFVAWLKRSPVHLAEYLRLECTWADLADVDRSKTLNVQALLAAEDANVIELTPHVSAPAPSMTPRPKRRFGMAIAASLVFAVAALFSLQALFVGRYSTDIGEQRTIRLEDGSTIALNTNTAIRVELTDTLRRVNLVQGEALFNVAKDSARPFRVLSDRAVAQAVGTSFVVRRNADDTVITVIEGQVAVARADQARLASNTDVPANALRVSAGERADVVSEEIQTSPVPNLAAVTAWKTGRLIFEGQALSEVVAEFNRYNRVQLVLEDSLLSAEQLSGVFDASDPQALVRFLERANVIEPAQAGDERIILTPRR